MRHVEGILDEVRRSYTSLKAQAEKAETYRTLREADLRGGAGDPALQPQGAAGGQEEAGSTA